MLVGRTTGPLRNSHKVCAACSRRDRALDGLFGREDTFCVEKAGVGWTCTSLGPGDSGRLCRLRDLVVQGKVRI